MNNHDTVFSCISPIYLELRGYVLQIQHGYMCIFYASHDYTQAEYNN